MESLLHDREEPRRGRLNAGDPCGAGQYAPAFVGSAICEFHLETFLVPIISQNACHAKSKLFIS